MSKTREKTGTAVFVSVIKFCTSKLFLLILLAAAVGCAVWFGAANPFHHEEKTTQLGFEHIGELATQEALATEVSVLEGDRELWGIHIPFTQSKYVFSYDVSIKAGYDFSAIAYEVDGEAQTIRVTLPQASILSTELDMDSLQVYHESESIFRPITLDETNQAVSALQETARQDAVANGLLENARANAQTLLTAFFAQAYDMDQYTILFAE